MASCKQKFGYCPINTCIHCFSTLIIDICVIIISIKFSPQNILYIRVKLHKTRNCLFLLFTLLHAVLSAIAGIKTSARQLSNVSVKYFWRERAMAYLPDPASVNF